MSRPADTARSADTVRFADYHEVPLDAGEYRLTVRQAANVTNHEGDGVDHEGNPVEEATDTPTFQTETTVAFTVQSPRYRLAPGDVAGVYPAAMARGAFDGVLPHVLLNRDTLPWERCAFEAETQAEPWLGVLVFTQQEWDTKVQTVTVPKGTAGDEATARRAPTVGDLGPTAEAAYPALAPESTQHPGDPVAVIDVESRLATAICPRDVDLRWLCHARGSVHQTTDGEAATDGRTVSEEQAVVIAPRALDPGEKGGLFVCCLVSLEGRWDTAPPEQASEPDPKLLPTDGRDHVRFVVLHRWSFICTPEKPDLGAAFETMVTDETDIGLRLPRPGRPSDGDGEEQADGGVRDRIAAGYVPIQHHLRDGSRSAAWYRGPLIPYDAPKRPPLTMPVVLDPDGFVLFDEDLGMWDVSYAAAWELGRTLAIRDRTLATQMLAWKRRHRQDAEAEVHRRQNGHIPDLDAASAAPPAPAVPDVGGFEGGSLLGSLEQVGSLPWRYLVADERLLPIPRDEAEPTRTGMGSVRAFTIDPFWIQCLRDGVFSVGRLLASDREVDRAILDLHDLHQVETMHGFMVRGPIVRAWPTLVCEALDTETLQAELAQVTASPAHRPTPAIRVTRPAPDVLVALFVMEDAPAAYAVHPPAQTMHFGLDHTGDAWTRLVRNPESARTLKGADGSDVEVHVPFRDGDRRVVDLTALVGRLDDVLPGEGLVPHTLALALFDAPDKVVIEIPTDT